MTTLASVYAKIPKLTCKGLCGRFCGVIPAHQAEAEALAEACPDPPARGNPHCPYLTTKGLCAGYRARPLVCFLPQTWVFTEKGPKRIAEILGGDRVYSRDGSLVIVEATNSRQYSGVVYDIRHTGSHIPCWCTGHHLWLTLTAKDRRRLEPRAGFRQAERLLPTLKRAPEGCYLTFPPTLEDRELWPRGRRREAGGSPQDGWEPPRLASGVDRRRDQIRILGNAWNIPQALLAWRLLTRH